MSKSDFKIRKISLPKKESNGQTHYYEIDLKVKGTWKNCPVQKNSLTTTRQAMDRCYGISEDIGTFPHISIVV